MEKSSLNAIQLEIVKALESLGDRARFSEAILAKKIRETAKIDGKKKAGIGLNDLEKAVECLESAGAESGKEPVHYSLMMNSANDLLIEKTESSRPLEGDARQRRLKSEKSMSILTCSDLTAKKSSKSKQKIRTERKNLNINGNFDDYE